MSNTKVYCYILGSSHDPDNIKCCVPTLINRDTIFVGPCIHSLRRKMFDDHLKNNISEEFCGIDGNEYIIGFNASNKVRKIVWAGKIKKLMTFEYAFNHFKNGGMDTVLFDNRCSPIHVKPKEEKGRFIGYEKRYKLHIEQCFNNKKEKIENVFKWHTDLIESNNHNKCINNNPEVENSKSELLLNHPYKRADIFDKDCCFVCKKEFFAIGRGLDINNNEIVDILKKAQPEKEDVDDYAIFGRNSIQSAIGLTDNYLPIHGKLGEELIKCVRTEAEESIPDITEEQFQDYKNRFKDCCKNRC